MDDVLLTGGGIIPEDDRLKLLEMGVGELFPPGADIAIIVKYIQEQVKVKRNF
jgi:methylmalonyl-CoA mutase C-terminal domain/subunit